MIVVVSYGITHDMPGDIMKNYYCILTGAVVRRALWNLLQILN